MMGNINPYTIMQTVTIDLGKSPDIADAVAGMEPGDEVCLHATIKELTDQTLAVTVAELSIPKRHKTDTEGEMENDDETTEKPESAMELEDEA